ncbi:hypothetical protein [Flammeovirga agarivorans]|uniref:Uncharacterized protein n=1 Tax=Flammeovirga agarivorans TaxID=2726742 RepID=A0A7X8SR93_9BACT|nr:hypothetical protein [Flammeovirga agarivorans]NLR94947.1 hypothetical protein [Flammeovirga agarivorans]
MKVFRVNKESAGRYVPQMQFKFRGRYKNILRKSGEIAFRTFKEADLFHKKLNYEKVQEQLKTAILVD